jgi:enediyne biosynthesis protein E4
MIMRLTILKVSLIAAAALAAAHAFAAETALTIPAFAEETTTSGVKSIYAGEWQYMVGGGAAAFDCNGDQYPDLLLAGGEKPAAFYRNTGKRGGELKFAAEKSGLELEAVTGAYPIDIDADGSKDVVLLRVGENVVMRGLGSCKFERANETWGFDGGDGWSAAFAATWEKGALWPTVAVGNYIDRKEEFSPWGSCTDNWLHRPAANGQRFDAPLALKPSFCPLSMLFTDWNRSGTPSLRISNDREYYEGGQEQLWHVDPSQPPTLYTEKEGWKRLRIWGMGIASSDINGDTYPDFFLTSMADNKLQVLKAIPTNGTKPQPDYADIAWPKGVTAQRPYTGGEFNPSTGWHAQFEDVNNDGLADLFVAKGNVAEMPDFARKDPNNLLLQGADGKFVEAGDKAGVASLATSRGAALTDFNLDGLVDLIVVNRNESAQVWRNVTKTNAKFIDLKLQQESPNRDGIGAWIEVKTGETVQRREITIGGGHAGGQLGLWHFGLGDNDAAEVRVLWPDGEAGDWQPVNANQCYTLARGKAPQTVAIN